jgi:hypothetical protein
MFTRIVILQSFVWDAAAFDRRSESRRCLNTLPAGLQYAGEFVVSFARRPEPQSLKRSKVQIAPKTMVKRDDSS